MLDVSDEAGEEALEGDAVLLVSEVPLRPCASSSINNTRLVTRAEGVLAAVDGVLFVVVQPVGIGVLAMEGWACTVAGKVGSDKAKRRTSSTGKSSLSVDPSIGSVDFASLAFRSRSRCRIF